MLKIGAKLTRMSPQNREKHFEVSARIKSDNGAERAYEIRAVTTGNRYVVSANEIDQGEDWAPGWSRVEKI